jgi:hypothetical protein
LTKLTDPDEITRFDGTTQQERNFSGFYSKKKNKHVSVLQVLPHRDDPFLFPLFMLLGGAHRDGNVHILAHMDGVLADRYPYVVVLLRPLYAWCLRLAGQLLRYTHLGVLINFCFINKNVNARQFK